MRYILGGIAAAVLTCGLGGAAGAQEGKEKDDEAGAVLFRLFDANRDGVVTKAEVLAFFGRADKNANGGVTQAEFTALLRGTTESKKGEGSKDKKSEDKSSSEGKNK